MPDMSERQIEGRRQSAFTKGDRLRFGLQPSVTIGAYVSSLQSCQVQWLMRAPCERRRQPLERLKKHWMRTAQLKAKGVPHYTFSAGPRHLRLVLCKNWIALSSTWAVMLKPVHSTTRHPEFARWYHYYHVWPCSSVKQRRGGANCFLALE